jgi:leucyl aminopeptidase
MEFGVKSGSPEKQRSACIVVGVFEPRRLSAVAEQLDRVSDGYLSSLLRRGDLEGKTGQMLLLHQVPGVLSERVLLVGLVLNKRIYAGKDNGFIIRYQLF